MSATCSITERLRELDKPTAAARSAAPPLPRSAKVELTARCDLNCYFCAAQKRPRCRGDMPLHVFKRIASGLRGLGVGDLGLFYIGESFLYEALPEAVRYAKEFCRYRYVFLTTNGLAATPQRVRECMLAGLDSLKFAFNWAGGEQFEAVTGRSSGEHRAVLANLKAARRVRDEVQQATGRRCGLYASSLAYDDEQEDRMSGVLDEIYAAVDEHYWLPLLGHRGLPGNEDTVGPLPVKRAPCKALFTELQVAFDGHVCACPLDASARFHMGDIGAGTYTGAWHSAHFQALRKAHLSGELQGTVCESCIAYED